ncbi:hypothetical protein [Paenarthrobacter sp. YIM B13468]|uniref:hypothetical protein n=1 Tax=Paenarthrobacter sp. YIM B13468 TaxID=3366295 RepID=UPI00366B4FA6
MSLTDHLRDSGSPVRAYLDGVSPSLADMQGTSSRSRIMAKALGLEELARSRTVMPPPPGVDAQRTGTAIDFRVRFALGGFDPYNSAAALGVAALPLFEDEVENGSHRTRVLTEAFDAVTCILENPSGKAELDRAALVLAHCEQVSRGGAAALKGSLGEALDLADTGLSFATAIDESSLTDLRMLMEANDGQLDNWRSRVSGGERLKLNPAFIGSGLVGGADADWLVGDTLIDSKAYGKLTVPTLRTFLRQLLGYVMLDLDDALGIRSVGLWLPRQNLTRVWSLDQLLGGEPQELLPKMREGFRVAAGKQQLAIRETVTQRRKHQILADNKRTPQRMLMDLARSDDTDIRYRVGRNAVTPEETVRELAKDRYAKAREGVARNERAPIDVLEVLLGDSSVGVRRAAAANHRTPRLPAKALERGRSAAIQLSLAAPATESTAVLLASGVHASVEFSKNRDGSTLDSSWFADFLILTRSGTPWGAEPRIPVPKASQNAAWQVGRSLKVPDWLKPGLPDAVNLDLMREGRPAWVRRTVADGLPVSEPAVRDRLLADSDPEIRWSALCRTAATPDESLGELLGKLATDRKERTRFRTKGDDRPSWARGGTPAERDGVTLQFVASHPSTPLWALRELMRAKTPEVLIALMENQALPGEELDCLLPKLRAIRSVEPRERLAASARIPAKAVKVLVDDRDIRVRTTLAENAAVSAEALTKLARDPEPSVRLAVVTNPHAAVELATSIAKPLLDSSVDEELLQVLKTVACRNDLVLPAELLEVALERLSKSRVREPDMRLAAASDERTGARTLRRLARSADEHVRRAVAENTRTPSEAMKALSEDADSSIRAAAACNETLDLGLLEALAREDEPEVVASAARSVRLDPVLLGELLFHAHRSVRSAAYGNPATRPEDKLKAAAEWDRSWRESAPIRADLEDMAASRRAEVRMQVASDPRTPPDILDLLGGERRSARVRRAVAANPNTPATALALLAEDQDDEVREAVAFNGATPPEVLVELAGSRMDLALIVALNPDVPIGILDALVGDPDPLVNFVASGVRAELAWLLEHPHPAGPMLRTAVEQIKEVCELSDGGYGAASTQSENAEGQAVNLETSSDFTYRSRGRESSSGTRSSSSG